MDKDGNTKLFEAAEKFCDSHVNCSFCPLLGQACINFYGDMIDFTSDTTLSDVYNMLYHIAIFVDDSDFMK